MRHKKYVHLTIALLIVAVALAVFAPAAFAGRITRIQYAQESFDTYMYKALSAGYLSVTGSWGTGSPVYPKEAVNYFIQTGTAPNIYENVDDATLYDPTINPVTNATKMTTVAGQEYWISVQPYIGDTTYSLTVELQKKNPTTPDGEWWGKNGAGPAVNTELVTVTGSAYGVQGEFYKDASTCYFYTVGQYWPGTEAAPVTNWNLYVSERADYVGGAWPAYEYPYSWESNTAKLHTDNGATGGSSLAEHTLNNTDPGDYGNELDAWFCVDNQQWSCAAVTNPWTGRAVPPPSPDFTYYPKPESKTWQANAPLWATYSFTQTTRAEKPGYMWGGVPLATSSARHFSSIASFAGQITWRYQGPLFSWYFLKGPRCGIAKVTVDGVDRIPVGGLNTDIDQYAAAVTINQKADFNVGGLDTDWHEVVVTGTARKALASLGYYIYHDKFVDPDGDGLTPAGAKASEDNYDGMTGYAWTKVTVTGPSGGAFVNTADFSAATAFTFQTNNATQANRNIKWMYSKGPRCGVQNVYIDGTFVGTVNQYNAAVLHGQSTTWVDGGTYSGNVLSMAQGTWHTIFITGSGSSTGVGATKGYFIYSDAFQAEGGTIVEAE